MRQQIIDKLSELESGNGVRVLYACESGSRAWGFASPDSDYDVRYIYARNQDWYLSIDIEHKRDTLEDINGDLDLSGWDLRKALWLFGKSNPALMEWLHSPVVYVEGGSSINALRELSKDFYSVKNASYHYYHMAQGNFQKYLSHSESDVWTKKYFYVLRPLLAVKWLQHVGTVPPVEFIQLLPFLPRHLDSAVEDLLEQKKAGAELRHGPRIPALHDWLTSELAIMPVFTGEARDAKMERLNKLFRDEVRSVGYA